MMEYRVPCNDERYPQQLLHDYHFLCFYILHICRYKEMSYALLKITI